jgi:hypothetical protein
MITIGIFGCSWSRGIKSFKDNWPYELSVLNRSVIIKNYSYGATSLEWSYKQFQKYKNDCDITIFQFTKPFRLTHQLKPINLKKQTRNLYTLDSNQVHNNLHRWTATRTESARIDPYKDWLKQGDDRILNDYYTLIDKINKISDYCFFFYQSERKKYKKIDCIEKECSNFNDYIVDYHFNSKGNKWLANYINQKVLL